jgi:hypothetical protein
MEEDRMLKWFAVPAAPEGVLPQPLLDLSRTFSTVAHHLCKEIRPGPERTVMLRKLLEAKDAAVRAMVDPG